MVSFELYVPIDFSDWFCWILVCVCDSNLRKFLVDDQVYGYPDLFLFFMDDQVCDFLGIFLGERDYSTKSKWQTISIKANVISNMRIISADWCDKREFE